MGAPLPVDATVTNGLFTVPLDFGNQFIGQARWLETAVKCAGDGDFIPQSPRLNMTSSPYAIGLIPGASIVGSGNQGLLVNTPNGKALLGYSDSNIGVYGESANYEGVRGVAHNKEHGAVVGIHDGGIAVYGESATFVGVFGKGKGNGAGVVGHSVGNAGVWGKSDGAFGVFGESANNYAIKGVSTNSVGVYGESTNSAGLYGFSAQYDGVIGRTTNPARYAVYADGKVAITGGTDIAERFSNASGQPIEPGTVVVMDEVNPGQIIPSGAAYARTVVGIISGAGGVEPGLILHQKGMMEGPHVVAIAGRVYVKATAANGAIKPGDLLTTSGVAGHAMKATDRDLAFGAIIGKALTGLDADTGLVLVLVNLQ